MQILSIWAKNSNAKAHKFHQALDVIYLDQLYVPHGHLNMPTQYVYDQSHDVPSLNWTNCNNDSTNCSHSSVALVPTTKIFIAPQNFIATISQLLKRYIFMFPIYLVENLHILCSYGIWMTKMPFDIIQILVKAMNFQKSGSSLVKLYVSPTGNFSQID